MTRTRVTIAILLVAAVTCAALALRPDSTPCGSTATAVRTPLFSPRRMPELIVDSVGAQRLQSALDADVSAQNACFLVTEGGQARAVHNPDSPLIPASTEKLLTAAAALTVLGPDFKYETKAVAAAAPQGGTLPRLWIVGAGDPILATGDYLAYRQTQPTSHNAIATRLEPLADAIAAQGVKQIPGGVVGDDSRYDQQRYVPSWPPSYRTDPDIGPLGALTVNDGYRLAGGHPVPVDDPALATASTLTTLLQARGIQVGPASAHVPVPAPATPVASVMSPALRDIVMFFLRSSDDLTAELLTKELSVHAGGPGTTAAGVQRTTATLQALGLPTAGLTLVDGSGLDRGNRATCRLLAAVLDLGLRPQYKPILDGLAVAGQDGTLAVEFNGTPLAGKLRAKTGFLNGVDGLVGSLDTGRPLRFALLLNGNLTMPEAFAARERFGALLATFPDAPAPDALVPAPAATH
jgi:D-alanyl-D-alanine carboxypeptidase/D-alanyl-D-alanine-endopeptidase (penicillin-binding protein 4)